MRRDEMSRRDEIGGDEIVNGGVSVRIGRGQARGEILKSSTLFMKTSDEGFSLAEVMIAMAILSIIFIVLSGLIKYATLALIKAKEQTYSSNFSQKFFAKLNNIPYPYIFKCDSSSASYGLTGTFGPVTIKLLPIRICRFLMN